MTPARLRRLCLSMPEAVEEFPFHPATSVFKVAGKVFALSCLDERPLTVSLKCEPELAVGLRDAHPEIRPGYHLNKRHWNTVTCDRGLDDRMVSDMVEDSYDLVVEGLPRKRRPPGGPARG